MSIVFNDSWGYAYWVKGGDGCVPSPVPIRLGNAGEATQLFIMSAMTEVTGIDHIYITVSDMARSEAFYDRVLRDALGFRKKSVVLGGDTHIQYYNRHFGFAIRPARADTPHEPYAPGLHHFCFRVDSVADVAAVADQLRAAGVNATEAQNYPEYAPDYWATYFSDPDGVRLEVTNYRQERRERHEHWEAAE